MVAASIAIDATVSPRPARDPGITSDARAAAPRTASAVRARRSTRFVSVAAEVAAVDSATRGLGGCARQLDDHAATRRSRLLGPDRSSMHHDDPLGNGEPEAGTSVRARIVDPVEALKHPRAFGRGDTGTAIDDVEPNVASHRGRAGAHHPAAWRE